MPAKQYLHTNFNGGMNLQVDSTRIQPNEYAFGINIRNRSSTIRPIKKDLRDEDLPEGNYQGLVSVGNYVILFVEGLAYVKNYIYFGSSTFVQIPGFQMSAIAPFIWAELVPSSNLNFFRKPFSENVNDIVNLVGNSFPSPQCLVVQDGITQPWIIFQDGTARKAQTYYEWTLEMREYIPIGKQMLFSNDILYIVSPDNLDGTGGNEIYRSVSGRPLDFMVNITTPEGDKLPLEVDGGAHKVSHRVSYNKITCLKSLGTEDKAIFVSTASASFRVIPNFENSVFGEPTFFSPFLFPTGCLNNNSFVDIVGDSVFIDQDGLRSFNAILQSKNEGRNLPFSARIFSIFEEIVQDTCSAIEFDDFAIFSVQTVYGPVRIVYDTITRSFVGLDIDSEIKLIKQFAVVKTKTFKKLVFITVDNKFFTAFSNCRTSTGYVYVGDWTTNLPRQEQKISRVTVVFNKSNEVGYIDAQLFVDGYKSYLATKQVSNINRSPVVPLELPFGKVYVDQVQNITFDFNQSALGWRAGCWLKWDFDAVISHIFAEAETREEKNSFEQQALEHAGIVIDPSVNTCNQDSVPIVPLINVPDEPVDGECVPPTIVFSPPVGSNISYPSYFTLVASDPLAIIYYTLDGSTPHSSSTVYTEPVQLTDASQTLRAIAYIGENCIGEVHNASYVSGYDDFQAAFLCDTDSDRAGVQDDFTDDGTPDRHWQLVTPIRVGKVLKRIEMYEVDRNGVWDTNQIWSTNSPITPAETGVEKSVYPIVMVENGTQLFTAYTANMNISLGIRHMFDLYGNIFKEATGFFKVILFFTDDTTVYKMLPFDCVNPIIPSGTIGSSSDDGRICVNGSVTISWNVNAANLVRVNISPIIGDVPASGTYEFTPTVPGTYNFQLTGYDADGDAFALGSINITAYGCYECPNEEYSVAGFTPEYPNYCDETVDQLTLVHSSGYEVGGGGLYIGAPHPNEVNAGYLGCIIEQCEVQALAFCTLNGKTFRRMLCIQWTESEGGFRDLESFCNEEPTPGFATGNHWTIQFYFCHSI